MQIWEERLGTAHAVEISNAMRWLGVQIEESHKQQASAAPMMGGEPAASKKEPAQILAGEVEDLRADRTSEATSSGWESRRSVRWLQHLQGYRDRKGLVKRSRRQTTWIQSTGELLMASRLSED